MTNIPYQPELKSVCCGGYMLVAGDGETHYYVCTSCQKACDPKPLVADIRPCPCACHVNKLNKPYEHDTKCCERMNGTLEGPPARQSAHFGVGMPATEWLDEFGSIVWSAFGNPPYLVGSALTGEKGKWRDVDVRLILDDEEWEKWGFGDSTRPNDKWRAHIMAFAELGKRITGLPIDFQIQQQSHANKTFDGARSTLGLIPLRETHGQH